MILPGLPIPLTRDNRCCMSYKYVDNGQPCPILVINLERSPDRWASASRQLAEAGLCAERLPAVDGRALSLADLKRIAPVNAAFYFKPLSPGEVGCYLSHVAAAERIVSEGWPMALVLEDDFELAPHFLSTFRELTSRPGELHDLTRLDGPLALPGGQIISSIGSPEIRLIRHRRPPSCTVAMLWTRAGAGKFLSVAKPLRRPVDVQLKHWWEGDLSIVSVVPPAVLLHPQLYKQSNIGQPGPTSLSGRWRRMLYRLSFAVRSQFELLARRGLRSWIRANFN